MSSSTKTSQMEDESPTYAALPALSAKNSMKRARIIFDVNPESAFIPGTDPTILQRSINRRRRRVLVSRDASQQFSSSALALVIPVHEGRQGMGHQMKPISAFDGVTSGALTTQATDNSGEATNSTKPTGILVVRGVLFSFCCCYLKHPILACLKVCSIVSAVSF